MTTRENVEKATKNNPAGIGGIAATGSLFAVAGLVQRAIALVLLPFFTRWLTPSDYGRIGALVAVQTFALFALPLGLEAVAMREYFRRNGRGRAAYLRELQSFMDVAAPALSIVLAVVVVASGLTQGVPVAAVVCDLFAAGAFVAGTTVSYTVLRAERRAFTYVSVAVAFVGVQVVARVALVGFAGAGVAGWVAADVLAACGLWILAPRLARVGRFARIWSSAVRASLRKGLPLVPHNLGHWFLSLADRLVLLQTVSLASLGVYTIGYQAGSVLVMLFTELNRALAPDYASRHLSEHLREPAFRRLVSLQVAVVGVVGLASLVCVPALLELVLPPGYGEAPSVAAWVIAGSIFVGLYQIPTNHITLVRGETGFLWIATCLAAGSNLLLNIFLTPRYGIIAAAVVTLVTYVFLLVLVRTYEHLRVRPVVLPDVRLSAMLIAALLVGIVISVLAIGRSPAVALAIGCTVFVFEALTLVGLWQITSSVKAKV